MSVWSSVKTTTYQMSNFDTGDHVEFDDISGNMVVTTGIGQAKGIITVPGGSPDQLMLGNVYLACPPGEDDQAYISYQWYNVTLAKLVGTSGTHSLRSTGENQTATAYTDAPATDTQFELRIIDSLGDINSITGRATINEVEQAVGGGGGGGGGGGTTGPSVFAEYVRSTSQVCPAGTETIINYATKILDSHDSVTVGSNWNFRCQYDGMHEIRAGVIIDAWAQAEGDMVELRLYRNNVLHCVLNTHTTFLPKLWGLTLFESYPLLLTVADFFSIKLYNGTATDLTVLGNAVYSRVSVGRLRD